MLLRLFSIQVCRGSPVRNTIYRCMGLETSSLLPRVLHRYVCFAILLIILIPLVPVEQEDSGATYTIYERLGTMQAALGQPNGGSKLCLSCHDGTIAIGSLLNAPGAGTAGIIEMSGVSAPQPLSETLLSTSPSNLQTDLSDDHPISFVYTDPTTLSGSLELNPVEINSLTSFILGIR